MALRFGDVSRVPGRGERDLWARVHEATRWAASLGACFFLKTDGDSWVRTDTLIGELVRDKLGHTLYWGHEVGHGTDNWWRGGCAEGTRHVHAECPRYMAGMGYVLSGNLVRFISQIPFNLTFQISDGVVEDAGIGLVLSGLQVDRVDDAQRFHDVHSNQGSTAIAVSESSLVAHRLSEDELVAAYQSFPIHRQENRA